MLIAEPLEGEETVRDGAGHKGLGSRGRGCSRGGILSVNGVSTKSSPRAHPWPPTQPHSVVF